MRLAPALAAARLEATDRELGLAGERVAARFLAARGLKVLARRLRTPAAEVDLVLLDGATLVVCEVKTARRAGRFRPGDRLQLRSLRRQARAARRLAREAGLRRYRVDLVEVLLPRRGPPAVHWTRRPAPRGRRAPPTAPPG